jgi:hypothetical protein
MSLPPTEWVAERRRGKKLYANAVSNRIEWLQRVAARKALATAYVRYAEENDDEADEMGDYVLEERFDGGSGDDPHGRNMGMICIGVGSLGLLLILLSFLR